MASTLRIASRALPRVSGSLYRAAVPARVLNGSLNRRQFSRSAARFEVLKRYTEDHEWISLDTDTKIATVGITDYAQDKLGEVVFIELPTTGDEVSQSDSIGAVESVKSASDIMAPVSGTVTEVNGTLEEKPKTVNEDPLGGGWIVKLEVGEDGVKEFEGLMDEAAYKKHIEE
ncbi:hypothetical protein ABW20_dc0101872 [Dactylellina cionopaga]|nr:hypothetical protein ABW20_dc0101872 [Dactylellina cionopaga]